VTVHDAARGPLLEFEVKPNMKVLGPKFGPRLQDVVRVLAASDHAALAARVQTGASFELPLPDGHVALAPTDVVVQSKSPEGWAGVADGKRQVLLDRRITPELELEGKAREIVRHVQELRKSSSLQLEDRIALHLGSDAEKLRGAIAEHGATIAAETLAVELSPLPLAGDGVFASEAKVDGEVLRIQLRRVERAGM
jgi:isoleucyl-tRNA synthetase